MLVPRYYDGAGICVYVQKDVRRSGGSIGDGFDGFQMMMFGLYFACNFFT